MTIVKKLLVSDDEIKKLHEVADLLDQLEEASEDDIFTFDYPKPTFYGEDLRDLAKFLETFRDEEQKGNKQMKRDYLFVFTEESDNAGDEVLCEAESLEDAYDVMYGYYEFKEEELKYVEEMSVEEGEWLGLDTY